MRAEQAHADHEYDEAPAPVDQRVARLPWHSLRAELDAQGFARIPSLLTAAECESLVALYPETERFRSRVVMSRHGFGRGEYQYFDEPLPELVAGLRDATYIQSSRRSRTRGRSGCAKPAASRTRTTRYGRSAAPPGRLGRRRCCSSTARATTTACIRISTASCLSAAARGAAVASPDTDFTGGEFVLTEQRPRMQSRAEVVPLRRGDARDLRRPPSPGAGRARRLSRQLRHGVSRAARRRTATRSA